MLVLQKLSRYIKVRHHRTLPLVGQMRVERDVVGRERKALRTELL